MDKNDSRFALPHMLRKRLKRFQTCCLQNLPLHFGQLFFDGFAPAEGITPRPAFHFCSVDEHRFVICFFLLLQSPHILVKQLLRRLCASAGTESRQRRVIRHRLIL